MAEVILECSCGWHWQGDEGKIPRGEMDSPICPICHNVCNVEEASSQSKKVSHVFKCGFCGRENHAPNFEEGEPVCVNCGHRIALLANGGAIAEV